MRLCCHWLGWRYNTYRRRRWCRVCGQQQIRHAREVNRADVAELSSMFEVGDVKGQKRLLDRMTVWTDAKP